VSEDIVFIWRDFVAMTVSVANSRTAVEFVNETSFSDFRFLMSETECASFVYRIILIWQVFDKWCAWFLKFCGGCIRDTTDISCKFDDGELKSETDTEERNIMFSCVFDSRDFSFDAS
jgi:hypothetical protein